jgi:hypothetical protein
MRRLTLAVLTVLSLLLSLMIAGPADAATITARSLLFKLPQASEVGGSTYVRSKFTHWIDADGDSCDTREEVLIQESKVATRRGSGCRILSGRWYSWYDGRTWTNPADVDIDHFVPLKEAWESGARKWTATNRKRFANDLGFAWSLDAVTDNVNQSKGAQDPATWLPSRARCKYATHWIAVKYRWRLRVNSAERTKLAAILSGTCGSKTLTVPARALSYAAATGGTATTTPPPTSGTDPRFSYCYQAIAAGYGPYYQGTDPEYDWYTDADSDGVVCES